MADPQNPILADQNPDAWKSIRDLIDQKKVSNELLHTALMRIMENHRLRNSHGKKYRQRADRFVTACKTAERELITLRKELKSFEKYELKFLDHLLKMFIKSFDDDDLVFGSRQLRDAIDEAIFTIQLSGQTLGLSVGRKYGAAPRKKRGRPSPLVRFEFTVMELMNLWEKLTGQRAVRAPKGTAKTHDNGPTVPAQPSATFVFYGMVMTGESVNASNAISLIRRMSRLVESQQKTLDDVRARPDRPISKMIEAIIRDSSRPKSVPKIKPETD